MTKNLLPREGGAPEALEEKPFLEHLEDLRRTIIKMVLTFGCAFFLCVPLTIRGYTMAVLKRPLGIALGGARTAALPTLYPAGGFAVAMKVATECALVLTLPILLYLFGIFVFPALTRRERRFFAPGLAAGAFLFYAGMTFCYFTVLPLTLRFFWNFNRLMGIENLWTINEYITLTGRLLIAFGLVFELPLVVLFLVAVGVLDYQFLSEKRRFAIVLIFIVAAAMTPGPDVVSQITMAVPLLALYELCIWGARLMGAHKAPEGS